MKLTPAELDVFATACARDVAPSRLEREVRAFEIVPDYEAFVKEKSAGQADPVLALFRALLHEFNERGLACDLAERLFFEISWSGDHQERIAALARSVRMPAAPPNALQALLKKRSHFITDRGLSELFTKVRPRVAIVVGTFLNAQGQAVSTSGTAFLVGPDLILTALHTFDPLLSSGRSAQVPQSFKVVFDYWAGDPIQGTADLANLHGVRVVGLHPTNWLVAQSSPVPWAGTVAALNDEELAQLATGLDFGLIRLDEAVGNLPVSGGFRARRGWFAVDMPAPPAYAVESQVVMPQHPQGMSMQHAFGRILGNWDPNTRVIYELETDEGSSGAPCLNSRMELIGIHSAAYRPAGVLKGNLAVRIDAIHPKVLTHLPINSVQRAAKSIWRVTRPGSALVPVLGRDKLQTWLDNATSPSPQTRSRSNRVYVADAPQKGAGKSFTADIVRTFLAADGTQNIIVLGGDTELIPETLEDFVLALAAGFGMSKEDLGAFPPRPSVDLPKDAKDGDKVDRWESQEMPEWFSKRLAAHRTTTVNTTEVLKRIVQDNIALGRPNTQEDLAIANANPPVMVSSVKWAKTWILLDDLDQRPLSSQVRKFTAGLIGADIDEGAVTDVRAELQWLFLGAVPEFLTSQDMSVETFSPADVQVQHISATFQAAFDEAGILQDPLALASGVLLLVPGVLQGEHAKGNLDHTPLSVCQQILANLIAGAYQSSGHKL
ncbi:serine protease [Mesorhizobium sp. M0078]|uniref:trypsin-like serine peptidase n=1 Tax=Mesorhizobium sp. M0078 TaxID=2956871 RepID=UPI00333671BB